MMIEKAKQIATNYNIKQLQQAFKHNINKYKPKTREEWERLIEDTILDVHEDAWTVFRYDDMIGELVFVNLNDGIAKYECTFDNQEMPKYFDKKFRWSAIQRGYMTRRAKR